jgi:hypothetical protein
LQKLKRRRNTKIIAETDRNTKLQKLKDSPNTRFCRSGRQNITPIFFFLQKLNSNTKLQKLKRRRNTKIIAETEQKYQIAEADTKLQKLKRRRNTKTIAEAEQKYRIAEAEESKIKFQILILQPQAQNLIFILHLLIGQTTHV